MNEVPDSLNRNIKTNLRYLTEVSENLIEKTDDYYSVVHESLPEIEKDIELTNQETEILIDYFLESKEVEDLHSKGVDDFFVSRVLKEIKNEFENVSSLLLNKSEVDEILASFSALKDGEKTSFDNFLDLLKEMENVLLRVKEISYNSIIFSARLGNEGKGFNVISDNLRKTSGALEGDINKINDLADNLINWHNEFTETVNHITEKREDAVKNHNKGLDSELITILKSMDTISDLLKDLIKNVKTSTKPFQELMLFIQRQDIIRQNLENLIKCLKILDRKYDELQTLLDDKENNEKYYGKADSNKEQILDLIVFLDTGMELLNELIENVKSQLEESLRSIINTSEGLVNNLEDIKNDSSQVAEFLTEESVEIEMGEDSMEEREVDSALGYTFKNLIESMEEFIELLKEVRHDVDELKNQKSSFDQNIEDLSRGLESVHRQVNFLQKVKLLSNIEVSRIEQGRLVGDRIDSIVEQIQNKVSDNKEAFERLRHDLNADLSKFDELVVENQKSINDSLDEVEASSQKLKTAKEAISNAVSALSQEVENLYNHIERIHKELSSVDTLYKFAEKLTEYSREISNLVREDKKRIMDFYNVSKWEKTDEELKSFYDQFTTYLERARTKQFLSKTSADEELEDESRDMSMDEGSEEGELTLF